LRPRPSGPRTVLDDRLQIEAEARVTQLGQQDIGPGLDSGVVEHRLDGGVVGRLVLPGDIELAGGETH
jgi:hypothetical protein